jgi:hypothetical protein
MKKKSNPKLPRIVFQRTELIEITDPAEIAALERRIRAAEKAMAGREAAPRKRSARKMK